MRYDDNVELTKPLMQAVLDAAKQYRQSLAASKTEMNPIDATAAPRWFNAHGDQLQDRSGNFIRGCAECAFFLAGGQERNRLAFAPMWQAYEHCGFPDAAKAGAKIACYAWAGFTKTEQGWMPVNSLATNTSAQPDQIATIAPVDGAPMTNVNQMNSANGHPMVPGTIGRAGQYVRYRADNARVCTDSPTGINGRRRDAPCHENGTD